MNRKLFEKSDASLVTGPEARKMNRSAGGTVMTEFSCALVLCGIFLLEALVGPRNVQAATFEARGNKDERHAAPPHKEGEVVVTFDTLPTRMRFDLPGHILMFTENDIPYMNGATETYMPGEGVHEGASYESWNDTKNKYSRMWIESQNDARIVVRHRCALIKGNTIVHSDKPKVAPYGPGNWTDEWYIFHPDGTYIRRVKIWNAVAKESGRHGAAKYPYELEGMYLWWGTPCKGKLASDHLEDGLITLIKMDGTHTTINFKPYPVAMNDFGAMYRAYGKFKDANIHVINTKSEYRPWRMGRSSRTVRISPYVPVHNLVQLAPCFPPGTSRKSGYSVAGLGQMNWADFWKTTDTSMSEVWLNGWTNTKDPADELVAIARSWQEAPEMAASPNNGIELYGYEVGERAYLLKALSSKGAHLELLASSDSPLVNPMFLINQWGQSKPRLFVDGKEIRHGKDFRYGTYKTLTLEDGRTWENVLAVWVQYTATDKTKVSIRTGAGPVASTRATAPAALRTWTSRKGTTLEARLVSVYGEAVMLRTQAGKTIRINRAALSESDQGYLRAR
jgi:hypothetical protein